MSKSNDPEGDKSRIWNTGESSEQNNFTSRFKPRCSRDCYITLPIVLSLISLFLVIGTIFGVGVRWSSMATELKELREMYKSDRSYSTPSVSKQISKPQPPGVVISYTRWGKKVCPGDATLVYSGFGAGSSSTSSVVKGGGAEYLCMPPTPEWNKFDLKNDTYAFSWIYGAEYLSYESYGIFKDSIHGHNVACSVCLAPRSTKLMIPAKRTCPVGWTREYEGYLMSSYVTNTKMSFECVDEDPDIISGTQNITGGAQMFFVAPYCGGYGGVSHCPPYITARELTCVVCTK